MVKSVESSKESVDVKRGLPQNAPCKLQKFETRIEENKKPQTPQLISNRKPAAKESSCVLNLADKPENCNPGREMTKNCRSQDSHSADIPVISPETSASQFTSDLDSFDSSQECQENSYIHRQENSYIHEGSPSKLGSTFASPSDDYRDDDLNSPGHCDSTTADLCPADPISCTARSQLERRDSNHKNSADDTRNHDVEATDPALACRSARTSDALPLPKPRARRSEGGAAPTAAAAAAIVAATAEAASTARVPSLATREVAAAAVGGGSDAWKALKRPNHAPAPPASSGSTIGVASVASRPRLMARHRRQVAGPVLEALMERAVERYYGYIDSHNASSCDGSSCSRSGAGDTGKASAVLAAAAAAAAEDVTPRRAAAVAASLELWHCRASTEAVEWFLDQSAAAGAGEAEAGEAGRALMEQLFANYICLRHMASSKRDLPPPEQQPARAESPAPNPPPPSPSIQLAATHPAAPPSPASPPSRLQRAAAAAKSGGCTSVAAAGDTEGAGTGVGGVRESPRPARRRLGAAAPETAGCGQAAGGEKCAKSGGESCMAAVSEEARAAAEAEEAVNPASPQHVSPALQPPSRSPAAAAAAAAAASAAAAEAGEEGASSPSGGRSAADSVRRRSACCLGSLLLLTRSLKSEEALRSACCPGPHGFTRFPCKQLAFLSAKKAA